LVNVSFIVALDANLLHYISHHAIDSRPFVRRATRALLE
jgi:hypothetical protein